MHIQNLSDLGRAMKSLACVGITMALDTPQGKRGVRCREMVVAGGRTRCCSQHEEWPQDTLTRALAPDFVLLRVNINPKWIEKLQESGVEVMERDPNRAVEISRSHVDLAQFYGVSPAEYLANMPSSGIAVFGKDGVKHVSAMSLISELLNNGFSITRPYVERKSWERMAVLVVPFKKNHQSDASAFIFVLSNLLKGSWEFAHIYANPPQLKKNEDDQKTMTFRITHTVNLAHRNAEGVATCKIVYNHGLWDYVEA